MTLQNLLAIHSLVQYTAQRADIQRLQTLPLTVGLDAKTMVILDSLRRIRNLNDYDGDPISPAAVEACQKQAHALLTHVRAWLAANRPDLT